MHYIDFSSWKTKSEKETNSNYIKTTGGKASSCNSVTYYYCNRRGYFCSRLVMGVSNSRRVHTLATVCRNNEGSAHALEVEYCATIMDNVIHKA